MAVVITSTVLVVYESAAEAHLRMGVVSFACCPVACRHTCVGNTLFGLGYALISTVSARTRMMKISLLMVAMVFGIGTSATSSAVALAVTVAVAVAVAVAGAQAVAADGDANALHAMQAGQRS